MPTGRLPFSPLRLRAPGLFALAGLLSACAGGPVAPGDAQGRYRAAIVDAAVVSPAKVSVLKALPEAATVSMVSWVTQQRAPCQGGGAPCTLEVGADRLWVTLAGEVQTLCRGWNLRGDALRERLEQLLGLPPDAPLQYRKVGFAVLEVARERVERPCLGMEPAGAGPVCTITAQPGTPEELRNFVGQQMAGSYVLDNPRGPGYPYTRLGYTYDWGAAAGASHYGASEFLIKPGSSARVVAQMSTDAYCAAPQQ